MYGKLYVFVALIFRILTQTRFSWKYLFDIYDVIDSVVPLPNIEKTDLESVAKLSLVCLNISVFLFLWVLLQYHSLAVFTSCLVCLPTAGFFLYLHSKLQQLFVVCCYPQGSTKLTQRSIISLLASKDSETLDIRQNAMKRQGL